MALVQRCQQGDRRALETLLQRHDQEVLNMATRLLGNQDDALDIRQLVYMKVCRSVAKFDGRSSFRTWLLRIVVNQCRDQLRRMGADRRRTDGWAARSAGSDTDQPGARSARDEQTQTVIRAVAALPEAQREVLVLRHYHDMTLTGAAELLEIPLSTAASRLGSAMKQLRDALTEREPYGCHEQGAGHAM